MKTVILHLDDDENHQLKIIAAKQNTSKKRMIETMVKELILREYDNLTPKSHTNVA